MPFFKCILIFSRHIENKHPDKLKGYNKGKSILKKTNPFTDSDELSSPAKPRTRSTARRTGAADDTDEEEVSEIEELPQSFTDKHYMNLTLMESDYKVSNNRLFNCDVNVISPVLGCKCRPL